jgi:hypothetical protein
MTVEAETVIGILPEQNKTIKDIFDNRIRDVEENLIEARVPLELINEENVPVDKDHAKNLGQDVRNEEASGKKSGQLSPVTLAQVNGFDKLFIIDGFHRVSEFRNLKKTDILANINFNCTMKYVIKERILAAGAQAALKLPRIAIWAEDAWKLESWSEKISLRQALYLRYNSHLTGKKFGVKDEKEKIINWINESFKEWQIHGPTFYKYFIASKIADPELICTARSRVGGRETMRVVTPSHAITIARALPNNYELQRKAAEKVVREQIGVSQTGILVEALSRAHTPEEIKQIIDNPWKNPNIPRVKSRKIEEKEKIIKEIPPPESIVPDREGASIRIEELRRDLILAEEKIVEKSLKIARLKGISIKDQIPKNQIMEVVRKAIISLPSEFRTEFMLWKGHNLSIKDVAKVVEKTESNVIRDIDKVWEILKRDSQAIIPVLEAIRVQEKTSGNGHGQSGIEASAKAVLPSDVGDEQEESNMEVNVGLVKKVEDKSQALKGKTPIVIFPEKKSPEDFKKEDQVLFLESQKEDMPGVVQGTEYKNNRYYVIVSFPRMSHRDISGGDLRKIPIEFFDQNYRLAKLARA